ncbi:MAG: hypothetical protein AMXMBFR13_05850 [Phycisphaerae bacterium]
MPARIALVAVLLVCTSVLAAENWFSIRDGALEGPAPFEVWGLELSDWAKTDPESLRLRETLEPLAVHGVNTVGFCLQRSATPGKPFNHQGRIDTGSGPHLTSLLRGVRNLHMGTLVSLFSAAREHWLASPEAYRTAAEDAARRLPDYHSVIFVPTDLFSDAPWPQECPAQLGQAREAIALGRAIKAVRSDAVLGLPAAVLRSAGAVLPADAWLCVAEDPDALQALLPAHDANSPPATRPGRAGQRVAIIPTGRFPRPGKPVHPGDEADAAWLDHVERIRLDVQPPLKSAAPLTPAELLTPQEQADGWVPLFNGVNLEGWTTLEPHWASWSVADGAIQRKGKSDTWLRSRKRYSSFILRLEYKIAPKGNSGVFVWSPLDARSSAFGMEVQIMGVKNQRLDDGMTGAIYSARPPLHDAARSPGEWNELEIACRGSQVKVTLNGKVVQDFDADEVRPLRGRLREGVIGLQDHGDDVWFRRIRIKELPEP